MAAIRLVWLSAIRAFCVVHSACYVFYGVVLWSIGAGFRIRMFSSVVHGLCPFRYLRIPVSLVRDTSCVEQLMFDERLSIPACGFGHLMIFEDASRYTISNSIKDFSLYETNKPLFETEETSILWNSSTDSRRCRVVPADNSARTNPVILSGDALDASRPSPRPEHSKRRQRLTAWQQTSPHVTPSTSPLLPSGSNSFMDIHGQCWI